MELKITDLQLPGKISFNYEELKAALSEKVKVYESMVYTDDQITAAKQDRANLNRLKKALNDERLKQEREFMAPFMEFKAQVAEIIKIIDKASSSVDSQVKAYEEQKKAEKLKAIEALWSAKEAPEWMQRNDPKWVNASVSMKSIEAEIDKQLLQIQKDLDTLDSMGIGFEAMQKYQATLDLNAAIAENARIKTHAEAKAKWEAEHAQMQIHEEPVVIKVNTPPEPVEAEVVEPVRQWIGFQAFLSVDEAKALGAFLKANGIKYKAI